ncbi:hypothetical protein GCM10023353_36250 [Tomitella cavernea]|uniref:Uncharacterized protein n=1 Tax=Tomitella cavernea TaxID=1387982 RepID=A0ABP9D230_9ACTN
MHNDGWDIAMSERRVPVFRPPADIDPYRRWVDTHGLAGGTPATTGPATGPASGPSATGPGDLPPPH